LQGKVLPPSNGGLSALTLAEDAARQICHPVPGRNRNCLLQSFWPHIRGTDQ
jgi:hypothetical protein